MNLNMSKPLKVAITLSPEEITELQIIIQDEEEEEALSFCRRLRRKVIEVQQRHCGDPDRLPGL